MSVLLRPTWRRDHQILTLAFATAISRAVDEVTGVSCLLKWPNDLMVRSHKIAGILAEGTYQGSRLDNLIVGLGVNANIEMRRFPKHLRKASTSIMHELGREVDRFMLTKKIIEEMDKSYRRFESGHLDELLDEIKRLCSTIGRNVRVTTSERSLTGYAVDVGDDGQLLVRLKSGVTVQFYAADIVHLR